MTPAYKKRELSNVTITHVSYVKRGANKKPIFMAKSDASDNLIEFDVKIIAKDDDEQKLLYGVVYEPDTEDSKKDFMSAVEIEKTAHEFLEFYRNIDIEHNLSAGQGTVVESYIAPQDFEIAGEVIKKGSWVLCTRATDEIWELWKSQEITGYSMFGVSRQTKIIKGDTMQNNWFQKTLNMLGITKTFDETVDETINQMSTSPSFIMSILHEDFYKNIQWDTSRKDELIALSLSMRQAADYIDAKVAGMQDVQKSDDTETTETVETETTETAEAETVPETVNPVITETEEVAKTDVQATLDEAIAQATLEIVKKTDDRFNELLSEVKKDYDARIEQLTSSLSVAQSTIEQIQTNSGVVVVKSDVPQKKTAGINLLF